MINESHVATAISPGSLFSTLPLRTLLLGCDQFVLSPEASLPTAMGVNTLALATAGNKMLRCSKRKQTTSVENQHWMECTWQTLYFYERCTVCLPKWTVSQLNPCQNCGETSNTYATLDSIQNFSLDYRQGSQPCLLDAFYRHEGFMTFITSWFFSGCLSSKSQYLICLCFHTPHDWNAITLYPHPLRSMLWDSTISETTFQERFTSPLSVIAGDKL